MSLSYINLSKQPINRGSRRRLVIKLDALNHAEKVIEILNLAIESVIATNTNFINYKFCGVKGLEEGVISYVIQYECAPDIKPLYSDSIMMTAVIKFMKAAGMNTGFSVEVQTLDKYLSKTSNRLFETYEYGILKVLSYEEVMALSKVVKVKNCFKGEQLIQANKLADSMFLVSEGSLEVKIQNQQNQPITLATLWPGDCVGEMSLLTGAPRSADVFARVDSILVEIKKEDLAPILQSNQRLVGEISELLAQRQVQAANAANGQTAESLRERSSSLTKKILNYFFDNK